jgi:transposase
MAMGHEVRLIPLAYVKPFVKRHKNDAVDAEAICEAAQRPSMRFVAVKSEEQQAAALVFRTRDLAVKQRTQLGNAIRGHLAEYGWVAPKGTVHLAMLADLLEGGEIGETLPEAARPMFALMVEMLAELDRRFAALDKEIARRARENEVARRLMTIPGIGPITATAIAAIARPADVRQGARLRRLGGVGAEAGIDRRQAEARCDFQNGRAHSETAAHHRQPRGRAPGEQARRTDGIMARRHAEVTVALANKMARTVWALLIKQENYRAPVVAAA